VYNLIKISGLVLLLVYCFFNLGNILYFKLTVDVIGAALALMAGIYFVQRVARASITGLQINLVEVMAVCLLISVTATILLQRILYESYIGFDGVNTHESMMSLWIVSVLWFLIGGAISAADIKESPALALILAGSVAAIMGFGIDAELFKSFRIEGSDDPTDRVSHLSLERYVVIPIVLAYALSPKTRWLVALAGVFCLFLLGGRTALFVFIITVIFMNLRGNAVRNLIILTVMGTLLFLGLRYAVSSGLLDPNNPGVNDILFLGGVSEDKSFIGRVQLFQQSLQDLPQQFLVGNYSITVERYGAFGTYIHNLLSAWQFYGFFIFLAILLSLLYCVVKMLGMRADRQSPIMVFSSFMLVYVFLSVVMSKYVGWTMLWFVLGLWMLRPMASHARRSLSRSRIGMSMGRGKKRRRKRRYTYGEGVI